MLILSRTKGESFVISDRFQATVAVIGKDFVDLNVIEKGGNQIGIATLYDADMCRVADGVRGIMIHSNEARVRLGLEYSEGVSIRRGEFI